MKHCMVVDDSDIIRRVARAFLERMGYMVTEAENGDEAIKRCEVAMPDLILLDWHMPGKPPFDAISAIRAIEAKRTPFIVYMTTENDDQDIARAIEHGANDCLLKPFDRVAFEGKITEIELHA
ncbi:MAG: response regulator [Hyphomicrobiaceae bacterium]